MLLRVCNFKRFCVLRVSISISEPKTICYEMSYTRHMPLEYSSVSVNFNNQTMTINIGLDINNGYNLSIVPMHNYMGHIKNNGASQKYCIGTTLLFPGTLSLIRICGVCAEPRKL